MNWAKWAVCLKRLKGDVEQKGRKNVQENRKNEKLSDWLGGHDAKCTAEEKSEGQRYANKK
jgi:hypothetical protein